MASVLEKFCTTNNLKVRVVSKATLYDGRLEAEFYVNGENAKDRTTGEDVISFTQYGTSKGLNEDYEGYPTLRLNEYEGIYIGNPKKYCSLLSEAGYENLKLKRNDVLICRTNGNPHYVGKAAIVMEDAEMAFASYLFRVRTNDKISPATLVVYINSRSGRKEVERYAMVSNQANFSPAKFRQISVPNFPLEIQEYCDQAVKEAYSKKTIANKLYKEAEEMLLKVIGLLNFATPVGSNLSIRSLGDVLRVSRLDAEYWQPKHDAVLERIKAYHDGYDTLPKLVHVSDRTGKIDPKKTYGYVELADIEANTGTISNITELKGSELPGRARMKLSKNDVIVSSVEGSLDKVAFVQDEIENLLGSTGFFVFQEKDIQPEVLLVMLKSAPFQQILKREAQGTILTAIPKTSLSRILLPKLDKNIQNAITKLVRTSQTLHNEAKALLGSARQVIEVFIEQDEQAALRAIKEL